MSMNLLQTHFQLAPAWSCLKGPWIPPFAGGSATNMSGVAPLCQPQSQSPAMSPFPPAIADATASKSSTSKHPVLRNGHVPTEPVRPQDTNHIHFPPLAYPEPSVSARWKFPERYKGWIGLDGIWIAWTYESWFFSKSWHVCKSQYIYIYYIGCSSTTFWRSLYSLLYFSLCVTLTFTSVTVWWGIWEGSKMKATWPQNEPICVTLSPGVKVTRIPKSRRHKPQHIRATCEIIHTLLSNVIRYKILFDIIITYY